MEIPESYQDLMVNETKAFAFLATIMPKGSPQVTPVWFSWDGQYILINSASGRVKDRNMRLHPQVALAIVDPQDMGRYLQIRGEVVEITTDGALEHANDLALKYTGQPWDGSPDQRRVIYRIQPNNVTSG
jgi:PPOX class probable F420-dependent enzyme